MTMRTIRHIMIAVTAAAGLISCANEDKKLTIADQEAAIDSELASSVQSALLEKIEVKSYPEEEVNKQIKQLTDTYAQMAEMYGMEMDEFLETYMQMTEDDFNAQAKEAAQTSVPLLL